MCLAAAFGAKMAAQDYIAPQVVVSNEKVRNNGRVYYSHVVQERQTLYSISKAYEVSLQEIYDANPTLNLETEGLKKNQIILIPARDEASPAPQNYIVHRVKWYEDLSSIARKYNITRKEIMDFNGMATDKVRKKQDILIPVGGAKAPSDIPVHTTDNDDDREDVQDRRGDEDDRAFGGLFDDLFVKEGSHDVSISLLLPFTAAKAGDRTSFMDFYCGSLMAARDLGNNGTNIDIHSFDVAKGSVPVTHERFSESDFAIGPISREDILKAASVCDGATWMVSPLDMQAESLADTLSNLIQAPTPTSVQIKDMVEWIKSDMRPGDKVIVITPKQAGSSYEVMVEREMNRAGVAHSTTALGSMSAQLNASAINRVVLACDFTDKSTVFLIEAVRNLYLLSSRKNDIVLYSTSKIRTYDQIEVEQLHKLNLHACVTYFADYNSEDVRSFVRQYRAVFNTEPSRSAYCGYDLMNYFSSIASKYGKKWPRALDRFDFTGLQSDFKLEKTKTGSYINNAVRRVIYEENFSITLDR